MELVSEFRVAVPIEQAWKVLTNVELIAPCMPGAQLTEIDGETFKGNVKVKVGPVTAQYSGKAEWLEKDETKHRAVLKAAGRDIRGQGNASAEIVAELIQDGDGTKVTVVTDLKVTGKVAQFGRGIMADVSAKILAQFVGCLEKDILAPMASGDDKGDDDKGDDDVSAVVVADGGPRKIDMPEAEAVNLIDAAGVPIVKRMVPLAAGFFLIWLLIRRRKSST